MEGLPPLIPDKRIAPCPEQPDDQGDNLRRAASDVCFLEYGATRLMSAPGRNDGRKANVVIAPSGRYL
jgi:hypothetical protein